MRLLRPSVSIVVSLAAGIVIGSVTAVHAGDTFRGLTMVNVLLNGKALPAETPAVLVGDSTYAPLRVVAEASGLAVSWDNVTRTVLLTTKTTATPKEAVFTDAYVSVSNVTVRRTAYLTEVLMEVTNVNPKTVSGSLAVTFYNDKGAIIGNAIGSVNEVAPGATKTVSLYESNDVTGYAKYKVQTEVMIAH